MLWFFWTYKDNLVFKKCDLKLAHITNMCVNRFDEMRYSNVTSRIFLQDCLAGTLTESVKKKHNDLR